MCNETDLWTCNCYYLFFPRKIAIVFVSDDLVEWIYTTFHSHFVFCGKCYISDWFRDLDGWMKEIIIEFYSIYGNNCHLSAPLNVTSQYFSIACWWFEKGWRNWMRSCRFIQTRSDQKRVRENFYLLLFIRISTWCETRNK